FARAIELKHARAAMREGAHGADRNGGMSGARIDENVAFGVGGDTRDFAEIEAGRQLNRVWDGVEFDLRRRVLRDRGSREQSASECDRQDVHGGIHGCSPGLLRSAIASGWLENQFLRAPGFDLADDDLIRIAAIHHVDHLEAGRGLAGPSEPAEYFAVELGLVDFAGSVPSSGHVAVRVRIRKEDVLVRAAGNTDGPPGADVGDLAYRLQVVVEHLIAIVGAIGDPDVALQVHLQTVGQVEFPRTAAGLFTACLRQEAAIFVILHDAVVAVTVGDKDVALRLPADIGRAAELVFLRGAIRRLRSDGQHAQNGERSPAEHHQHFAFGAEFDDHVRAFVDGPDVVVLIDAHRMGELK